MQPAALKNNSLVSDYNGYAVACNSDQNAYIKMNPAGGIAPYIISHKFSESKSDSLGGLPAGVYNSTITDFNGCILELTHILKEPEPLLPTWSFVNPNCAGLSTGSIVLAQGRGGVPPYLYQLNNGALGSSDEFQDLTEGPYRVEVKDRNNCSYVFFDTLIAAEIPVLSPEKQSLKISLGEFVPLEVMSNLDNQVILWSPANDVVCPDCLQTKAKPLENIVFTVKATSKDGCETMVRVQVEVEKRRSFTMANIFTPDKDGANDRLTYVADTDVERVEWIAIYDRWGSRVFYREDLPIGIAELAWDGTINGRDLMSGVYTWTSRVRYIDGIVKTHSGTISLIR
jgi:gliding motility-associated-like protein